MDWMLLLNGAGVVVAGVVWFLRARQGQTALPSVQPGFAGLLQGILSLIDALDDEPEVKTELGKDLFALLQEYLGPTPAPAVPPPPTLNAKVIAVELFNLLQELRETRPASAPP